MIVASIATSQSRPSKPESNPWLAAPDDRYVKLLAGKKLEDAKGFPDVVVIGDAMWNVAKRIGSAREEMEWLWWYFYEKGPWQLTVCCVLDARHFASVHAIIVAGEGAPPTSKGIKVGDPVAKVTAAYGASQPFRGALVGMDEKGRTRTWHMAGPARDVKVDDPPEFKDALFFPAAGLLVAVKDGRVFELAIVGEEDSLPEFLRPEDKIGKEPSIKLDPGTKVPKFDPAVQHGFLVPPPPKLVDYKGDGYTARVPMGWTLSDGVWKDPDSVEAVTVRTMGATAEESSAGALFALIEVSGGENIVPDWRQPMPASFCKMVGATEGACAVTVTKDAGKEGLPLRTYYLMLTKGSKRFLITATRTQHPQRRERENGGFEASAFMGCPDGDALARGVMRGFRIAP
jgi:hypothetical protein